jgi:hypothetical protein
MIMEKTNWKAWVSVVVSAFLGGVMAHISVPHEGLGAKQIVLGALLAGATAVTHLFQQPKLMAQEPKVEEPKVEEPKVEEPKVEA